MAEVVQQEKERQDTDEGLARVQALYRGRRDRAWLAEANKAATCVQRYARGMLVRQAIKDAARADWAATTIQSVHRGRAGRAEFMHRAAEELEMLERERLAEERAAIAMQSAYRGRKDQKAYQDTLQHVTKIQSHMRGYLERALLEQQMELEWAMLTTAAATTIQAAWRGHAAKTAYGIEYSEKSGAVLGIQTAYRRSSATRQYEAQKKAGLFV